MNTVPRACYCALQDAEFAAAEKWLQQGHLADVLKKTAAGTVCYDQQLIYISDLMMEKRNHKRNQR